jgi:proteasome lid subunit RPN8/RPN11
MTKKPREATSQSVAIDAEVLRNIRQHARSSLDTEICGVLIGSGSEEKSVISASISGLEAEQSGTHVTFTQDTWQHIYAVKDRDFPDDRIIGWYHSHPGFGVFLSDHDTFIHRNFFSAPGQVAWVFDPVSDEEGCFIWQDKEIRRADKIVITDPKGGECPEERSEPALAEVSHAKKTNTTAPDEESEEQSNVSYMNWIVTVLSYIIVFALGAVLCFFLLPPPERIIVVPVDPATGQPLDPRLRDLPHAVMPRSTSPMPSAQPEPPTSSRQTPSPQPREEQRGK